MLIGAGGKPQQAGGAFRQAIARARPISPWPVIRSALGQHERT
jgi:hypothetical protein